MKGHNYPGYFVTFEGGEGGGKTTQIDIIGSYLRKLGYDVHITREPGMAGDLKGGIRELLLNPDYSMYPQTELLLYAADRSEHFEAENIPALKQGKFILSDRSYDSTTAYQGYARKLDMKMIMMLNNIATFGIKTDLTLVLDLPVEEAFKRLSVGEFGNQKDRIEKEAYDFHERLRRGFLEIALEEPYRVKVIDTTQTIEEVAEDIKLEIYHLIKGK